MTFIVNADWLFIQRGNFSLTEKKTTFYLPEWPEKRN